MFDRETMLENKAKLEKEVAEVRVEINRIKRRAAAYGEYVAPEILEELETRRIQLGQRIQKILHELSRLNKDRKKERPRDFFRKAARTILDEATYLEICDYAADLEADAMEQDRMCERAEGMVA